MRVRVVFAAVRFVAVILRFRALFFFCRVFVLSRGALDFFWLDFLLALTLFLLGCFFPVFLRAGIFAVYHRRPIAFLVVLIALITIGTYLHNPPRVPFTGSTCL